MYELINKFSISLLLGEFGYLDKKADKISIKTAIEQLFDVKVVSVNTANLPLKKRRVGKFIGKKPQNKKAIVTLAPENSITFFENA